MRRLIATASAIALACAASASLSGCQSVRNPFFAMSSDSPVPFFGAELTLPPKLSTRR